MVLAYQREGGRVVATLHPPFKMPLKKCAKPHPGFFSLHQPFKTLQKACKNLSKPFTIETSCSLITTCPAPPVCHFCPVAIYCSRARLYAKARKVHRPSQQLIGTGAARPRFVYRGGDVSSPGLPAIEKTFAKTGIVVKCPAAKHAQID